MSIYSGNCYNNLGNKLYHSHILHLKQLHVCISATHPSFQHISHQLPTILHSQSLASNLGPQVRTLYLCTIENDRLYRKFSKIRIQH